jgi:putative hemolysin
LGKRAETGLDDPLWQLPPGPASSGAHIVDELLEERCRWLHSHPLMWRLVKRLLYPLAQIDETKLIVDLMGTASCDEILSFLASELRLDVHRKHLHHLPSTGPCIIVANHPTGMVDGLAIHLALKGARDDIAIFSNRDAVRAAPALADLLIPVEWMEANRTPQRMRETVDATRRAFALGKAVVIFPAGGIARITPRGVRELAWLETTAKLVRKHRVPVVPLYIHARNSALYYMLELMHPELRDLMRFREIFLKRGTRFDLTFGPAIDASHLTGLSSKDATEKLHHHVEFDLPHGTAWSPA